MGLDKHRLILNFDRAAASYNHTAVLQRRIAEQLVARLSWVKLRPTRILDLGCGTGFCGESLRSSFPSVCIDGIDISANCLGESRRSTAKFDNLIVADAEMLPIVEGRYDLVVANLLLHWCDPGAVLWQIRQIIRPGGLLVLTTFGPDTLKELRSAWSKVDDLPHIHDFIDMHDIGDGLGRCGFSDAVMDVENYTLTFKHHRGIVEDLRALGATNIKQNRSRGLTGKGRVKALDAAIAQTRTLAGLYPATFEVIFGHAWVPFDSQRDEPTSVSVAVDQLNR